MKKIKLFIIMGLVSMLLTSCGAKAPEPEEDPQEKVIADISQNFVRICKTSACKLGYQSGEIINMYASGEMSQEAAAKLLKMNYEDIKYLYDLKIYSQEDDKYLYSLYGNVVSAFDELYEEGDGYIDNIDYIAKCIEKLAEE